MKTFKDSFAHRAAITLGAAGAPFQNETEAFGLGFLSALEIMYQYPEWAHAAALAARHGVSESSQQWPQTIIEMFPAVTEARD